MPRTFAKGTYAMGECQRSGRKMRLRDMVSDGRYPWMMVDPVWKEDPHPQERLKVQPDPTTLRHPATENLPSGPAAPVLDRDLNIVEIPPSDYRIDVILTWTQPPGSASLIIRYDLYRIIDEEEEEYTLFDQLAVDGIDQVALTLTDDTGDISGSSPLYKVRAVDILGQESEFSNVV